MNIVDNFMVLRLLLKLTNTKSSINQIFNAKYHQGLSLDEMNEQLKFHQSYSFEEVIHHES